MVSKLTYSDRYLKALKYIFGRTLICRNLEVATHLARSTRLDCVTLDGDQVSNNVHKVLRYIILKRRSVLHSNMSSRLKF